MPKSTKQIFEESFQKSRKKRLFAQKAAAPSPKASQTHREVTGRGVVQGQPTVFVKTPQGNIRRPVGAQQYRRAGSYLKKRDELRRRKNG